MCGIIGILNADEDSYVNQQLFDGLTVLQHRGQDAAGMVTAESTRLHLRKDNGLVKDVFKQHHMLELRGNMGIGHVRYPTAGSSSAAEAQPLYTNYPFGISVAHNGNLTNTDVLKKEVTEDGLRHVNTDSDSEVLLNLFAVELTKRRLAPSTNLLAGNHHFADDIFKAMSGVMRQCEGGYSGLYLINGVGMVGFRDPHGIRPIVFGSRPSKTLGAHAKVPQTPRKMSAANSTLDHCFASESVAIDTLGFTLIRDVAPGEAIFVGLDGNVHARVCHSAPVLSPCIFEYVYFARPDSIMDGVSVYESRLQMGSKLARSIEKRYPDHDIDVVIPIPDTSRTSALQLSETLGRPYREGFIKNRYIARTFIMPGQEARVKSVRLKLNSIKSEFFGKNVLLVDDSIVRGTTAREIVQMARDAGAKKVYFTSCAPPIRFPNIYGIDIPTQKELVAFEREEHEVAAHIGCDWVLYQNLEDLLNSVKEVCSEGREISMFDHSCFSGSYCCGQKMGDAYFTGLAMKRNDSALLNKLSGGNTNTKDLRIDAGSSSGCEGMGNDDSFAVPGDGEGEGCEGIGNDTSVRMSNK